MELAGARIDRDDEDGLIVSGPASIAAVMRRLGASLTPAGWRLSGSAAERVRKALAPRPPRKFKSPTRVITQREELPDTAEMRTWFAHLPVPDGLKPSQPDSYTVGLRLKRHMPAAVDAIKAIPARRWNPNRGQWEVPVRLAAMRAALEAALHDIGAAIDAGADRDASVVRVIYPLEHAPDLDKPIVISGSAVRFFKNGSMFRLNEGHSRQYPNLAPFERQLGLVFYGRAEDDASGVAGKLLSFEVS